MRQQDRHATWRPIQVAVLEAWSRREERTLPAYYIDNHGYGPATLDSSDRRAIRDSTAS